MTLTAIEHGRIVTPESVLRDGTVILDDGVIDWIGSSDHADQVDTRIDAEGRWVLPGLIDLHGDDHERHMFPRDEATVEPEVALHTCDRENLAAGVTTKFHAVAFESAPSKNRSIDRSRDLVQSIATARDLVGDHRIHARCEVSDPQAVEAVSEVVPHPRIDLVSVMRHVPGTGQYDGIDEFRERYTDGGQVTNSGVAEVIARRKACDVADQVDRIHRVIEAADRAGVVTASHDDESVETIEAMERLSIDICEYPVTLPVASRATELGMTTAMGAPNLVRGGSLWGNLETSTAIDAGAVDVLCSDYHPYSLLRSMFIDTGEQIPTRVARVTATPAKAAGLSDRGRLQEGYRGDLIVVDGPPRPAVTNAFVAGQEVYRTSPPR